MKPIMLIVLIALAPLAHMLGWAELRTLSALAFGVSLGILFAMLPDDVPRFGVRDNERRRTTQKNTGNAEAL